MAADGLYQRVRPTTLDDVVGQPEAVKVIRGFKKIPNAVMFHGNPGTGKSTMARIMARMLGCPPENRLDYQEINCGLVDKPLETIKDIQQSMTSCPATADVRVWVLDEIQAFRRSRFAMEGMLKVLEDGPNHAYFFLATTDPKQIIPAIRSRCTSIPVKPIPDSELAGLVKRVAKSEKANPPVDVTLVGRIVEAAQGSARVALVELEKVLGISDPEERLAVVSRVGAEKAVFDLVKVLMPFRGEPVWSEVAKVLEDHTDEEPESLRQMLLSVARSGLLKDGNKGRGPLCYKVIRCLDTPFYDKSGHAHLAAACWMVCFGK